MQERSITGPRRPQEETKKLAEELGVDVHEVGKWQSGNAVWQAVLGKGEEEHQDRKSVV